ncbi:inovirus Gp2 family protein [Vreelandella nanhaiensis]|uniref:Inovirus Gp2 family protein n=1 Tax=Vreelandella nanhaiensis TaxID=1258546 RepID=A0A3S0YIR2_9GAMM|nr:inovirus Gp2 family protein [Halomonas nanhaiensis]RUR31167.1 inovirus Gp2 family protein [Halomonas nanhaiensis]
MIQRLTSNPNVHYHYSPLFNGMPVQVKYLPMVTEYLEKLQKTLENALEDYSRVLAIRVEPVIPTMISDQMTIVDHMLLMPKFIASLRAIIKHDLKRRRKSNWVPDTKVRFVWTREVGDNGKMHYHFFLILNRGSYFMPGKACSPNENLISRVSRAWYSALGVVWNPQEPWIYVPDNPFYGINRGDESNFQEAFYRASYLCKADTKQYGLGIRSFSTSHN